MDEMPFMSLRKKPAYETMRLLNPVFWFSMLVFLLVVIFRVCLSANLKMRLTSDRTAVDAATYAAVANLLVLGLGYLVLNAVSDSLRNEIPVLFILSLILPIIATVTGLYLCYRTVFIWKENKLGGVLARTGYSVVALAAAFMCWFYYFWNILGFQLP